jgi:hypothetical protein
MALVLSIIERVTVAKTCQPTTRGPLARGAEDVSNRSMKAPQSAKCRLLLFLALMVNAALGSSAAEPPLESPQLRGAQGDRGPETFHPLPDIPFLMHQVEANQRRAESIEKTYLYRSLETQQEQQSGGRQKITTVESEHFWINGVPVRRVLRRNGKDLSPDEVAKEDKRIENQAKKGHERREKTESQGKESDPQGHEEITVSRLLELGAFTNPRRVDLHGRPTIAVDYTGDPHAKTHNRTEDVIRDMSGTAWVDEEDKVLVRVEGRFVRPFKIGAGLVADIKQDTNFTFEQTKVNDEVWLPSKISAQGAARAMLFFAFAGKVDITDSDYKKFRTSTTILPDSSAVPHSSKNEGPN